MIKSCKTKDTQTLYEGKTVKKWLSIHSQIERRLQILDMATSLNDLRNLPSNQFEALKGDRSGQYSIRINLQLRICFLWVNGEPHDVEIVDYH
ncbi:MAG: type II toxin-antitoxin system RelE/ParE family toxin [Parachlamydiaceae bacterium]|nr:type II toxin-antitoxin system RelE/ParE family toxin [Parachlamydiaceae bacterium]